MHGGGHLLFACCVWGSLFSMIVRNACRPVRRSVSFDGPCRPTWPWESKWQIGKQTEPDDTAGQPGGGPNEPPMNLPVLQPPRGRLTSPWLRACVPACLPACLPACGCARPPACPYACLPTCVMLSEFWNESHSMHATMHWQAHSFGYYQIGRWLQH